MRQERLHDRAKRAKRERERERERGHTEGQRNCIKSHPLLAPLPQRRVTWIALTKETDLICDPTENRKNTSARGVPFETIFVVHRCFCWTKRKPMSSVRIARSTFCRYASLLNLGERQPRANFETALLIAAAGYCVFFFFFFTFCPVRH